MVRDDEKGGFYAVMLFLVWPFLAAASSLKNYKKPWAKNIFWLFCIFYGLTFSIGAESENSDIVRYVAQYQELHGNEMTIQTARQYYQESGEIDIARTAIAIGLSRLSDATPLLTVVYAIIFGFFLSRNMWYVMERLEGKLLPITIFLLVCFFLVNPIWKINGFRMWTAAHIFLYGMLPYMFEGKKKGLWISGFAILFHFAYILPFFVLVGVALLGKWLTFYFSIFLGTLFISEINLGVINNFIETYAPEAFQERTASYRVEEDQVGGMAVADGGDSRRWYARWHGRAMQYAVTGYLIIMFITGREYIRKHPEWLNLMCYVFAFFAAANMLSSISSSGRFMSLAILFSMPLIIMYIQNIKQDQMMKRFTIVVSPLLALFAIVSARIGIYTISATSILGNPIVAIFLFDDNMSLNDFLRMIL